jgi:tetratricopeptide (TPR) repeat protein
MLNDLPVRVRLCCATELAAVGAYLRAESLLTHPPGTLISPLELDLLARIYVQQERFAEARVCWEEAASAVPANPEFPKALAALSEYQERLRLRHRIALSLYAFMALIGLAAVLLLLLFRNLA